MVKKILSKIKIPSEEEGLDFYAVIQELEVALIKTALSLTNGNKAQAAKLLHLERTAFLGKMKRFGLKSTRSK